MQWMRTVEQSHFPGAFVEVDENRLTKVPTMNKNVAKCLTDLQFGLHMQEGNIEGM